MNSCEPTHSRSFHKERPKGVPLSTYTEQRLASMARFTSRLTNTESGFDELTLAQSSSVTALGQYLVALLRDRENRR
tara:strand:+ start:230 stop:460 length:231 start_codon:yes stop_codon:yes gene_type:complete